MCPIRNSFVISQPNVTCSSSWKLGRTFSMQCAYVLVHVTMATVHISHSCGTTRSITFYQTLPLGWVWRARLGIKGFKTNHSQRVKAATRLYQSGVDEQQIMERTGHQSIEWVRSYKRTSEQQREALSDIPNRSAQATSTASVMHSPPAVVESGSTSGTSCAFTSQQQLRSLSLTGATFHDCKVNFYVGSMTIKRRRPMVIADDSDSD